MDWVEILQQCSGTSSEVLQQLQSITWPMDELYSAAPTPLGDDPYGRRALYSASNGEVMLMSWRAGGTSAPHDHGASRGYVVLLEGRFAETFWGFGPDGLAATPERYLTAPAVVPVTPGSIHSMSSIDRGLSLHIYTPSIERMRVYDHQARRTLVVTDDCGAWIPRDERFIMDVDQWG
jgi:predicted metal-dependent enzyme (double-stranded beta helix superfamily)